jgi:SepF-like predicted cell division protein (DUF552 family)
MPSFFEKVKAVFKSDDEQMELPNEAVGMAPSEKVTIRVENLMGINDIERLEKMLKEGYIVFLKVLDIQRKDLGQFKQAVQMLKRRCIQYGWDIVGIEDGYMVLTPKFAKIARS